MAINSAGFRGWVSLVDNGGNVTTKSYDLREPTVFATAKTDMQAIVTALDAVTDAVVKDWGVSEVMAEGALTLPANGVQIENQALLTVTISGEPMKSATLTIPAPNIGIFTNTSGGGADTVDTSDATLIAYTDLFKTGGKAYISDGESMESVFAGKRIHRKSRRG